ncbi:hypothetical protein F2Q69_00003658 [Brassica cretica]|uniref:Uncharacterized protein n=1 Tax=Brassica cretica TaxID=69181 RepID=A0A8S9P1Z6_BRACR|nr:hypothetical protein F2Q69_00003658 [Brassica cretica]
MNAHIKDGDYPCPFRAPGHFTGFRLDDPTRSPGYIGFPNVEQPNIGAESFEEKEATMKKRLGG